jgi:hypothetical protein
MSLADPFFHRIFSIPPRAFGNSHHASTSTAYLNLHFAVIEFEVFIAPSSFSSLIPFCKIAQYSLWIFDLLNGFLFFPACSRKRFSTSNSSVNGTGACFHE